VVDQEVGRMQHHRIWIEVPKRAVFVHAPRERDRKRNFVELNSVPVRLAVDPEILRKAAVRTLRAREVDEGAQGGGVVAGGGQAGDAVDHVAGPDEMITAEVVVALGLAPGDAERSDQRAGIGFVLVGEQQLTSAAIERAAVAGKFVERSDVAACALPLLEKAGAMFGERLGERLIQRGDGAIELAAEAETECEGVALAQIEFGGESDVAVERGGKLIIHLEV